MRISVFLLIAITLAGCVPWPTLTRPELTLAIVDESGTPVEGADVTFASFKMAFVPDQSFLKLATDESGKVHIARESVIEIFILAPDGGFAYDWSYCISKPGYEPLIRNALKARDLKSKVRTEILRRSEIPAECNWQEFPHGFVREADDAEASNAESGGAP